MPKLVIWIFLWSSALVQAAPREVTVVYQATHQGQPFATVTETFRQQDGRYQITSVTEGMGAYALFGKRVLQSSGEVTAQGLRPLQFQQTQAGRMVRADFDWQAGMLTLQYKGKTKTQPLLLGTQDVLSYAYQFMFQPPRGGEVVLPVTTGRRLREYRYLISARNVLVESPAGKYHTMHLKEAAADDDSKEFWLGTQLHHIPVRILMKQDNGAVTMLTLTNVRMDGF